MLEIGDPRLRALTPSELVGWARMWLDEHPDAPSRDRVAVGVIIACGGDPRSTDRLAWRDIIEAADCSEVTDAIQAMYALLEEVELRREQTSLTASPADQPETET